MVTVLTKRAFKREEMLSMALELDQNQELNIYTDRGFVVLEIPKKDEFRYFVKGK